MRRQNTRSEMEGAHGAPLVIDELADTLKLVRSKIKGVATPIIAICNIRKGVEGEP